MKVVRTYGSEMEAELARTHLKAAGIKSFISKDDCGGMEVILQLTNGVKLQVADEHLEEARQIIAAGGIDYQPMPHPRLKAAGFADVFYKAAGISLGAGFVVFIVFFFSRGNAALRGIAVAIMLFFVVWPIVALVAYFRER
jgi:putative signal transducing protein